MFPTSPEFYRCVFPSSVEIFCFFLISVCSCGLPFLFASCFPPFSYASFFRSFAHLFLAYNVMLCIFFLSPWHLFFISLFSRLCFLFSPFLFAYCVLPFLPPLIQLLLAFIVMCLSSSTKASSSSLFPFFLLCFFHSCPFSLFAAQLHFTHSNIYLYL